MKLSWVVIGCNIKHLNAQCRELCRSAWGNILLYWIKLDSGCCEGMCKNGHDRELFNPLLHGVALRQH